MRPRAEAQVQATQTRKEEKRRDGSGFEAGGGWCAHPHNVRHARQYDQKRPF